MHAAVCVRACRAALLVEAISAFRGSACAQCNRKPGNLLPTTDWFTHLGLLTTDTTTQFVTALLQHVVSLHVIVWQHGRRLIVRLFQYAGHVQSVLPVRALAPRSWLCGGAAPRPRPKWAATRKDITVVTCNTRSKSPALISRNINDRA